MDSLRDAQNNTPPTSIDQFPQFHTSDLANFSSVINGSHSDAGAPPSHSQHSMSSMFPPDLDHSNSMSLGMHMTAVDLSPMDVVPAPLPERTYANGMLSDFSGQAGSSFQQQDPQMNGIEASHQLLSSPSATTASTSVSHASSPSMNGMVPAYAIASSSLASALDSSRSRSGSSASPGHLAGPSPDLGFPSSSSIQSNTSIHDPAYPFPYENSYSSTPQSKENSPDGDGQQRQFLGTVLKQIAAAANSGSEAVSNGQTTETLSIVDSLKKTLTWVSDMLKDLDINEQHHSGPSTNGSPHAHPAAGVTASHHHSPQSSTGFEPSQLQHINGVTSYSQQTTNTSLEQGLLDPSDMSRKRCASTAAGDRIVKAMKMEPPDDVSLQMLPIHPPQPPHMNTSPVFPYIPVSRPASSSGLPLHHPLNLMADIQQSQQSLSFPSRMDFNPQLSHSPSDFPTLSSSSMASQMNAFSPTTSLSNASWSDNRPTISRHSHSLSGSSVLASMPHNGLPMAISTNLQYSPTTGQFSSPTHSVHPSQPPLPTGNVPPSIGRMSRSSSISQANPFAYGIDMQPLPQVVPIKAYEPMQSRPSTSGLHTRPQSPEYDDDDDGDESDDEHHLSYLTYPTPPSGASPDDGKGENGMPNAPSGTSARRGSRTSPSAESNAGHGNEVPQEYKADVERIFFEFLNKTCLNLDATDSKGEPIHQTLMAKKMQRLDESPDFRPFKFRIQAFTNAFLEELARQGFPEEKIPMKKIRNFLWNQPFISRFNEEGKKSKSKGNHIWHVDAKKTDGGWMFRPFQRKLAGAPPGVAYIGLRWSWTPRIWDPQASRSNMPVTYNSPSLPSWLSWSNDTLSGIPPPDAENCDVTVEAQFIQDGKEESLSHTVHLNIAPMAAVDASFTPSRRPSLVGDLNNPRRVMSDSVLSQTTPPRALRGQTMSQGGPVAPDSQVVQVLTTAAQRVAQEAQSQVVGSPNDLTLDLNSLAKQQHVLTVTAQAFNNKSGDPQDESSTAQSNALTAAAQQVVLQAARQVAADRTVAAVSSGIPNPVVLTSQVTVKEVSVATQSAVAQAVEMIGPLSSEVDVLMTAKSLIQQQMRSPLDPGQLPGSLDQVRPHSTGGTMLSFSSQSSIVAPPPVPAFFQHTV